MGKKKILFLAEAVTLAHVVRPLVLAQALDAEQYDVHFAADDRYDFVFRDSRVQRGHRLNSISSQQFLDALASGARLYQSATLNEYVAADQELIQRVQPDLVVGDFRLSLAVSAPLCKVPYATITNAYWSPYSTRRWMPLPEHAIERAFGARLGSALFRLVQPLVFRYHALPLNRLRRRWGLSGLGDLRGAYTHADYTWYADIPRLAPTHALPGNHRYLGPVLWSPPAELPPWWSRVDSKKPVIYASLGSSGNTRVLPELLRAVESMPVTMMLATAGRVPSIGLPGNVLAADYVPGELAAARAAVVVCNGGSPSVYQALSQGTPVLGIPSNMDQHLAMEPVEQLQAGILVRQRRANSETLRHALVELVGKACFTDRARGLAEELRDLDACANFPRFVVSVFKR